ncbi:hypothetical protein chiPu_0001488 [Chiloscyllium punctatum]|uniref:Integrase catalytic domain-containing protein n=1 Tax=Chiloscyllium punctatum TaxID=137246 RepID=A0A401RY81_CHIPU|nr:hypothetical protein [Chiloscyllium punctatum]
MHGNGLNHHGSGFLLTLQDMLKSWMPTVVVKKSVSADTMIDQLGEMFAMFGNPGQVVSDNDPQLVGQEFEGYLENHGIRHVNLAPYHLVINSQAERLVQTFKQALKAQQGEDSTATQQVPQPLQEHRVCNDPVLASVLHV